MKKLDFEILLFDLDGTITDSAEGILKSVEYALSKMGKDIENRENLRLFLGPPLKDLFKKYCDFSDEEAEMTLNFYRERFAKVGIYENTLYEGIEEVLIYLRANGKKIYLATSKPEQFAKEIIRYFEIEHAFDGICGATMDESMNTKDKIVEHAIKISGAVDKSKILMIGDRKYDMEGARSAGIKSLGVLYGYGTKEELEEAGADYIIPQVKDYYDIF